MPRVPRVRTTMLAAALPAVALTLSGVAALAHAAPAPPRQPAVAPSAAPAPAPAAAPAAVPVAVDASAGSGQKVLFDTDFGQLNDDSQALYLLLQGGADVLGITTVSGNTWSAEGAAYALRQLELVHREGIPVYQGASDPLLGSRQDKLAAEGTLFGKVGYTGAWGYQRPSDYRHLAEPPYQGYATTAKAAGSAVSFIVDQVKRHPHEVTLFVLGPATNVALAVRTHPEIVPLVKQVIYMGGAYDVPGNEGPAAEFNVWFDPEASRIALTAGFPKQTIVPLDVTNTVHYGIRQYQRIVGGAQTPITQEFKDLQGPGFAKDPSMTNYIYDSLTAGIFLDPSLVTRSSVRKVEVDTNYGFDYGRTLGYQPADAPIGAQQARVVQRIDIPRFFNLYVKEMTAPVRH